MKRITTIILFFIILTSSTCQKEVKHYDLTVKNTANASIYVTWTDAYPDTLIRCPLGYSEILPGKSYDIKSGKYGWENDFKGMQFLQIFIIDAITGSTEACDTIRLHNMILKRYTLTYENLQQINWKITYP